MGRTDDHGGLRPGHGTYTLGSMPRQRFDVTLLSRWPCNEAANARSEAAELNAVAVRHNQTPRVVSPHYLPVHHGNADLCKLGHAYLWAGLQIGRFGFLKT